MTLEEIKAKSKALREKHEASMRANPRKAAYVLLLWEHKMALLLEEELEGINEAAIAPGNGLTNHQRREWVREERRSHRNAINEKFLQFQKAVS